MISEKEINLVGLIRRDTTTCKREFSGKRKKRFGREKGKKIVNTKIKERRRSLKRVRMRIVKGNGK